MVKTSIAICDDEAIWINTLKSVIKEYFDEKNESFDIHVFSSGKELLSKYYNRKLPSVDILFLDINMPDADGIAVKEKMVRSRDVKRIIFLSSHPEAMDRAFGIKVTGFITKPYTNSEIFECLDTNLSELEESGIINYKDGTKTKTFFAHDLVYIEAQKDMTVLTLVDLQINQKEVRQRLQYWRKLLPEKRFVQIHRGFIVNLDYVSKIKGTRLYIETQKNPLSIGRKYLNGLRTRYEEYLFDMMKRRG